MLVPDGDGIGRVMDFGLAKERRPDPAVAKSSRRRASFSTPIH